MNFVCKQQTILEYMINKTIWLEEKKDYIYTCEGLSGYARA